MVCLCVCYGCYLFGFIAAVCLGWLMFVVLFTVWVIVVLVFVACFDCGLFVISLFVYCLFDDVFGCGYDLLL